MTIDFIIEDKIFKVPADFADSDSFVVKSIPKPYQVSIKNDPFPVKDLLERLGRQGNNLLLVDKKVYDLYLGELEIDPKRVFLAEATESFKTLDGLTSVIAFLEKNEFTKGETLFVVGGGIIEDVGAFVGACYKRGINWVYYPTTLLSMCDSCIGGKTGINHNRVKNQLALFSAPAEVVINTAFLKTLPAYDIKSGMGEILKLCVTGGKAFIDLYQREVIDGLANTEESYKKLILGALAVKRAVVEEDEFELNHRKSLNYGHTIGHALEVLSEYRIPHGQAVIMGMAAVNKLALARGILSRDDYTAIQTLAHDLLGKNILHGIQLDDLRVLLKKDKKTQGNMATFVTIARPGDTKFLKLSLDDELICEIETIIKEEFE